MSKLRKDAGQALVVVALGMVVVMGFMGLALDVGYLRYTKRQVQMGADAAAIAGASVLNQCSTNDCSTLTAAAQAALAENGLKGSTLVTQAGGGCTNTLNTNKLVVAVNNPPCYLGSVSNDPHFGNASFVEVVVSQVEPLMFAQTLGAKTTTVTVRSEAALPGGSSCLFALNPAGTPALTLAVGDFTSQCGVVDESKSKGLFSPAFLCLAGLFQAPYIGIVGNGDWLLCNNNGGANPTNGINVPNPADPLAYLQNQMISQSPSPASCGASHSSPYIGHKGVLTISSSNSSSHSPAILNSGTYCGGIVIKPGAYVTFNSGIYTLTSTGGNGGLTIDAGTTVYGKNVAFYNYGPSGAIQFLFSSLKAGAVTLSAPTSGPYAGILFFQDPGNTSSALVIGAASWNTKLTGGSYFPNADITFALDLLVDYDIVVAKDITLGFQAQNITINSNFYNNYSALANGTPIKGNGATIVE